jgi:hypothetical protein
VWSVQKDGKTAKISHMQSLKVNVQNKCLRKITGSYKRAPTAALERETGIQSLNLNFYTKTTAPQRVMSTVDHPVYKV